MPKCGIKDCEEVSEETLEVKFPDKVFKSHLCAFHIMRFLKLNETAVIDLINSSEIEGTYE